MIILDLMSCYTFKKPVQTDFVAVHPSLLFGSSMHKASLLRFDLFLASAAFSTLFFNELNVADTQFAS